MIILLVSNIDCQLFVIVIRHNGIDDPFSPEGKEYTTVNRLLIDSKSWRETVSRAVLCIKNNLFVYTMQCNAIQYGTIIQYNNIYLK